MKYLRAFLIAVMLALASVGGVRPTEPQTPRPAVMQQQTDIKQLGDGFQLKVNEGWIMIHFPESAYLTEDPASTPLFKAAVRVALKKAFKLETSPEPYISEGELFVDVGDDTFVLKPLLERSGEEGPIVGIVLKALPRA